MKKIFICILMLIVMTIVFVGCDTENKEPAATATPKVNKTQIATNAPTATPAPTEAPTEAPKPEPGTNVALNKNYEVSSETDDGAYLQWGWSSSFLNDGVVEAILNEHTGWTTNVAQFMAIEDWEDQWALIDLGQVVSIDKVVLYPRQDTFINFPIDYYIEVSTDNKTFTKVANITGDTHSADRNREPAILPFDAVDAKYVKLVVTKPYDVINGNDGFLLQLAEFEIYAAPSTSK